MSSDPTGPETGELQPTSASHQSDPLMRCATDDFPGQRQGTFGPDEEGESLPVRDGAAGISLGPFALRIGHVATISACGPMVS